MSEPMRLRCSSVQRARQRVTTETAVRRFAGKLRVGSMELTTCVQSIAHTLEQ
jgi:hypothetical protein